MPPGPLPDQIASIHIGVPVQHVWDEITKLGRVQRALYDTVLECQLVPGSRLRYYSPDRRRVFVVGEVVRVEPPRIFAHTYRFTTWKSAPPTLVTWELTEEPGGCRVTITHSGWIADHRAPEKTGAGWREILALLKQVLETGALPLKARILFAVMSRLTFLLPRTTRTAYVDAQDG